MVAVFGEQLNFAIRLLANLKIKTIAYSVIQNIDGLIIHAFQVADIFIMSFSTSGTAIINTGTIAKFDCELMYSVGLNVIALPSKQTVNVGIQKDGTLICQVGGSSTSGSFVGSFCIPVKV